MNFFALVTKQGKARRRVPPLNTQCLEWRKLENVGNVSYSVKLIDLKIIINVNIIHHINSVKYNIQKSLPQIESDSCKSYVEPTSKTSDTKEIKMEREKPFLNGEYCF